MADEELAPEGEAGDVVVETAEEEQREPTASEIAAELGWTPKDQWQGDPEKWKSADQFLRDGRDIQQSTARELKSVREQIERLGGATESIIRDKLAERDAYWQSRMDQAVDEGDKDTVRELLKHKPQPAMPTGPDRNVSEWIGKNPWYNADPLAQARAQELSQRLSHLPVAEQLSQVERAIRKEFPEHFPKAKDPPGVQTAAARNPNPSNRQKGFADMPAESQRIALDFEKRHGTNRDVFAKSYWENEAREGVKR